jgi:hypothetical protein
MAFIAKYLAYAVKIRTFTGLSISSYEYSKQSFRLKLTLIQIQTRSIIAIVFGTLAKLLM